MQLWLRILTIKTALAAILVLTACVSNPAPSRTSTVAQQVTAEQHSQTQTNTQWLALDPQQTAVLDLPGGRVLIALNSEFAPQTVTQFKHLLRQGFYTGLDFYRVIDGFVAQGGDGSDISAENPHPTLAAEFERTWDPGLPFVSVQVNDLYAAETGFINGFPAARDLPAGKVWLTHCPGTVAMARGNTADSGSTDFYIVIGQAPRYLDRNLTIFGRVIAGMEYVQQIRRGPSAANGIIQDAGQRTPIQGLRLLADLPPDEWPKLKVTNTNSSAFADLLHSRRHRQHEFFLHTPPAVLDICQIPLGVQTGAAEHSE